MYFFLSQVNDSIFAIPLGRNHTSLFPGPTRLVDAIPTLSNIFIIFPKSLIFVSSLLFWITLIGGLLIKKNAIARDNTWQLIAYIVCLWMYHHQIHHHLHFHHLHSCFNLRFSFKFHYTCFFLLPLPVPAWLVAPTSLVNALLHSDCTSVGFLDCFSSCFVVWMCRTVFEEKTPCP